MSEKENETERSHTFFLATSSDDEEKKCMVPDEMSVQGLEAKIQKTGILTTC